MLQDLPPFPVSPRILRTGTLIARILPGLTMMITGAALSGAPQISPFYAWISDTYGLSIPTFGGIVLALGLISVIWSATTRNIIRAPLIDAGGLVLLTFPLWFFIGLLIWYVALVAPTTSKVNLSLDVAFFFTQVAVYLVTCGLRLWALQIETWLVKFEAVKAKGAG